jgi:predicted transcriptional regulator of viral defense system
MQSVVKLRSLLERYADSDHYLFATRDFAPVFRELSEASLNALLSRAQRSGLLVRVCKGIYLYPRVQYPRGLELFHTAARLRADHLNYISLETALSDAGAISQVPVDWITVMSSGRSHSVSCGRFGTIEFVHTKKRPADLTEMLVYDRKCRMWRASVALAVREMRATRRSLDLIDWSVVHEHAR